MKVEDCIVTVERRSVGGCIDLAFVFTRRFMAPLYRLTLVFAVPALICVWLVADARGHDVVMPATIIFVAFSSLLSGAIVATVGPQVFGVPLSTKAAIRGLLKRAVSYVFLATLFRVTGFCMVVPLLFVMAWCGHLPEVMLLENTPLNQVTQRLSWLVKGGGYSRNLGRLVAIFVLWILMALGIFLLADVLSALLFNTPIFSGTIAFGPDIAEALAGRLIDDPMVTTTWHAALWLTYPLARLAWFFCYLDQRIRNECWDLDLQFRVEAVRLEEQMT